MLSLLFRARGAACLSAILLALMLSPSPAFADPAACPKPLRTFHMFNRDGKTLSCFDAWQQDFFAELGCDLQFVDANPGMNYRVEQLSAAHVEVITGLAKRPDGPFQYSRAIGNNNSYLYRHVDSPQWDQIKDWCDDTMQQATLIAPAEGYYGEKVEMLRKNPQCAKWLLLLPRGTGLSFDMLQKKRADLMVSSERYYKMLPPDDAKNYVRLPNIAIEGSVYLAFSAKVSSEFIQRVNQQVLKRRASGTATCELSVANSQD